MLKRGGALRSNLRLYASNQSGNKQKKVYPRYHGMALVAIHYSERETTENITVSYFNFEKEFGRGKLVGVNQNHVSGVHLSTTISADRMLFTCNSPSLTVVPN